MNGAMCVDRDMPKSELDRIRIEGRDAICKASKSYFCTLSNTDETAENATGFNRGSVYANFHRAHLNSASARQCLEELIAAVERLRHRLKEDRRTVQKRYTQKQFMET